MNPSYCRIRVPPDIALERFAGWRRLSQVGPLVPTTIDRAVELACDDHGMWRGNAVFVSQVADWTLLQDLSGQLGGIPADCWREYAGLNELVFVGYNDAIGYGEFVALRDGQVIREYLVDRHSPESNVNVGITDSEGEPFESWVDVASFVDSDELGFCEAGSLWLWGR